jgi:alkylation response protein AidB-like acyl-CoA dehydrogenase
MTESKKASGSESFGDLAPWSEPAWYNSLTSPYYNESHRKLRDYVRNYLETNVIPHAFEWEAAGDSPASERMKWAKTGIPYADVPAKYRPKDAPVGPAGIPVEELDVFHLLVTTDETSRVPGAVLTSLAGASVIGLPPVLHFGTEEQKQKWLPGLFNWTTSFCLGITEPTGGSDVGNLQTTATKTPDGQFYVVNGFKKWITGAPWATHMTTAVRTGPPGSGAAGISMLVIPMDLEGVSRRRIPNSGQNAGGASLVTLDEVRVPVANLLGRENDGFRIIMRNFNRERFVMATGANRMARTCLSAAADYAHRRETFGQKLISHQIIRHKLATMAREVEAHWAWLEQLAYHIQHCADGWWDPDIAGRLALAKVQGGVLLEKACREAQQVLGGAGYQRGGSGPGAHVEQISRDLRMWVVGGGSEEILQDLAVRQEVGLARRKGWKL